MSLIFDLGTMSAATSTESILPLYNTETFDMDDSNGEKETGSCFGVTRACIDRKCTAD